ncbi:hypothetical protein CFOL_v3_22828 [Cephalotus follicularis]|uniref:Uncharacterized protein n=1 Tax=Cephalotus follicularis TaxID=3775 RepID=A0A1Q3CGZ6_CEPFO|nr:hypothetical protein CFOL_v3_22828 [Cephalotus follicularis]
MSLIGLFVLSMESDVVIIADRIAAGLHSGCAPFKSAATPAACGHDIDVPDNKLKSLYRDPELTVVTELFEGHAAKTKSPGAVMSGFKTNGQLEDGPLEL